MRKTALIMAGGRGERFWPKSRKYMPKQFLSLTNDGKTMIQLTVERILPLVKAEDIFVVTNQEYKDLIREQLPLLPENNILCEPMGKNTAPCIGLGAVYIAEKMQDAVMIVLPSDHLIRHQEMFLDTLLSGISVAESGENLVTIGIAPTYPETGYGYIKYIPEEKCGPAFKVERFAEKPSLELAKEYISSDRYLWNSGMFIWKASTILSNLKQYLPDMYSGLDRIRHAVDTDKEQMVLEKEYAAFLSESIDFGVMEKARNIYILPGSFGWDDVGSWLALERIRPANEQGNIISGKTITVDTKNCIIQGDKKLIAAVGLENMVIVDTEDALLVCEKSDTGKIKKVLDNLKICNLTDYL